jgi:hypothetical protein
MGGVQLNSDVDRMLSGELQVLLQRDAHNWLAIYGVRTHRPDTLSDVLDRFEPTDTTSQNAS